MKRRDTYLPYAPPTIGEDEIDGVLDTLRSGWLTTGPKVERFERAFAGHVGAPEAVAVASCTAGLHTALACLDIGPGHAVLTTPLTFPGTVNAIEHTGARPVLVDVDPETLNLCPQAVQRTLGKWDLAWGEPRALLPVHYGGHPCDVGALFEIAAEHGLAVVEDAAHALPARVGDHLVGGANGQTVPWMTSFSFYANKNLTTGEGGMLTGSAAPLERARVFSRHGLSRDGWRRGTGAGAWRYDVLTPGYKFNMTDLQAAIGLAQLGRLGGFHERRVEIARRYGERLGGRDELRLPVERPGYGHAWHLFAVRLGVERLSIDRDRFIEELAARNVGASVHFIPVHLHAYYAERYGYPEDAFPVAMDAFRRLVSLPIYPRLTDADVDDVADAVLDVVAEFAA